MKIKEVKVNFGFTKNIGKFEFMRVDVAFAADLGQGDDARQVVADLEALAKAEVRRIIKGKIEKKPEPKAEDYF